MMTNYSGCMDKIVAKYTACMHQKMWLTGSHAKTIIAWYIYIYIYMLSLYLQVLIYTNGFMEHGLHVSC